MQFEDIMVENVSEIVEEFRNSSESHIGYI
jgi:hypothetical protein